MTAAATSTTSFFAGIAARPVAGKLICDTAAARPALQRPLQRLLLRVLGRASERLQPVLDDGKVLVLVERVERDPQAEALGERNFLLDGLAGMDLLADVTRLEVLLHVLGHEVAPVGGGADQQVLRRGRD